VSATAFFPWVSGARDVPDARSGIPRLTAPTEHLAAPDGHRIPLTVWPSEVGGGALVVCVHAFGDYRIAFAEIAELLNRFGHTVAAYDQRGFGETPARGAFAGAAAYAADLATVVANLRKIHPNAPVVILAESFGASVALHAIATATDRMGPVDGLILSGPGVREDLPARGAWDLLIDGAAVLFGRRAVTLDQSDERLSERASRRLSGDPLALRDVRADTYERVVALADAASLDASAVDCPTLVLYGAEDGLIARASIDALMHRLGPLGTLRVFDGRPHLVLQARERDDVEREVLHFLSTLA
jgi:acylglycerol lipase